jgi:predicted TIM-barrel fold metal-dependent hydrolase
MLIDVHHHALPPFVLDAFASAARRPSLPRFPDWTPDLSLALLDRFEIDRALLSMPVPGAHLGDDAESERLARRFNDYCADLAARQPRFRAFAALPLPFVDGSLREIEHALDELRLPGVGLFASYGERFLGDLFFEPIMAELDRRAAIVFVHPMGHPSSHGLALRAPLWMLEYPIDTTRAALNLMLTGTLDRFRNIRFILAHAGGALPFLHSRLAGTALIDPRLSELSEEKVSDYLKRFFYETAQASGAATFASLAEVTTPDHVLLGTDFPYCGEAAIAPMMANLSHLVGGRGTLRSSGSGLFTL